MGFPFRPRPGAFRRSEGRLAAHHLNAVPALLFAMVLAAVLAGGCTGDRPILVGFSGQLTGIRADLGVQGRNGAMLAVEAVNALGGVNGRPLKLLAEDDLDTPEGAVRADLRLLDRGVAAIIGHMTSSQTLAACPAVESRGGVLISPTSATPLIEGRADGFFRVIPTNTDWAKTLATYAVSRGLTSFVLVGDTDNAGYTDTFLDALEQNLLGLGGRVAARLGYSSRAGGDWPALARSVREQEPQALVACTSARDLVSLVQALNPWPAGLAVLGPPWPATRDLILVGGRSVEGFLFASPYADDNDRPAFLEFREAYKQRFGWSAGFAAAFSYESVLLLAQALARADGDPGKLKAVLSSGLSLPGVIGPFSLDPSGDVRRPTFMTQVRGGRLVTIRGPGGPS
jgi:branched-chain amino acid transport system substrate-binding protein